MTGRPIALTMGEPAGIGPDITLAAWMRRDAMRLPAFYCLADPEMLGARARALGIDCPIETVAPADAAGVAEMAGRGWKMDIGKTPVVTSIAVCGFE